MRKAWLLLIRALAALAGCGGAGQATQAPPPSSAAQPQPARVTLLFDGPYVGFYAPFYAAAARGYYWRRPLGVLVKYEGLKHPLPLAGYYTDRFAGGA